MNTNISETFTAVRKLYGLSQEDMAVLLGCSRVGLSNIETGKTKNPGADKYEKLLQLRALKTGQGADKSVKG
jgi:transcriptional regulator with XRE-family HTH domain